VAAPLPSTLSRVGQIVRDRIKADAFPADTDLQVTIGSPGAVAGSGQESTETNIINLFFYRIEPSGFYADTGAQDRWYIRLYCLITAFSIEDAASDPKLSAGEVDLRLLGEVMRYFNEKPIIMPKLGEDDIGSRVQAVFTPLSSEEINQIWSTQGDVPYRPSLRYEFALLPIEPTIRASPPLPVVAGGIHLHPNATMAAARRPPPTAPPAWISPSLESGEGADWVPALTFVSGGVATQSLTLVTAPGLKVPVWAAGPKAQKIDFVWQHIDKGAWTTPANGIVADQEIPEQFSPVINNLIDPAQAGTAKLIEVAAALPTLDAQHPRAQLLLYAQRKLPDATILRSNPLILTVKLP
jgi:hypothetical protein